IQKKLIAGDNIIIAGDGTISSSSPVSSLQQVTDVDSVTTHKITASNLKLSDIPEYENNDSAIAAGLEDGDVYRKPYNNGNYDMAIVYEEPVYNFDVTATWSDVSVTDAASFKTWIDGMNGTDLTINDFELSGGRLRCNVVGDVLEFYASDYGLNSITEVNVINLSGRSEEHTSEL